MVSLFFILAAGSVQWLGPEPTRVERIVSLAPSATELIFALGAGDRVVGGLLATNAQCHEALRQRILAEERVVTGKDKGH